MRNKKKIRKVLITVVSVVVVVVAPFTLMSSGELDILILDAIKNDRGYLGYDHKEKPDAGEDVDSPEDIVDAYDKYDGMLKVLNLDKLPSMDYVQSAMRGSNLYKGESFTGAGVTDLKSEFETYSLICEILSRDEINPADSSRKIEPYMIYGSWLNESNMIRNDSVGYNPNTDLTTLYSDKQYIGPLSMDNRFLDDTREFDAYTGRMYTYISKGENSSAKDNERVFRGSRNELNNSTNLGFNGVNNDKLNLKEEDKADYIANIRSNIKVSIGSRPNPLLLTDSVYTFSHKLRETYDSKNIYTLNEDKKTDWESIDSQYDELKAKFPDIGDSNKNVIDYMYAVHMNSSQVEWHSYNSESGELPYLGNDYTGLMPALYFEMLAQHKTLNYEVIVNAQFSSVSELKGKPALLYGTSFASTMHSQPKSQPNLIDTLNNNKQFVEWDLREVFDMGTAYVENNSGSNSLGLELARSFYYPLRCVSYGQLIQKGIEKMIQVCYDYQVEQKIINPTGSGGNVNNSGGSITTDNRLVGQIEYYSSEGMLARGSFVPDSLMERLSKEKLIFPICKRDNGVIKITDSMHPGMPEECPIHGTIGHNGVDFTFLGAAKPSYIDRETDIVAMYDGVVESVVKTNSGSYGVHVILKHEIPFDKYGEKIVFYTRYAHMKLGSLKVDLGSEVEAGAQIGVIGTTGRSSGIHLHFMVFDRGKGNQYTITRNYDFGQLIKFSEMVVCAGCSKGS